MMASVIDAVAIVVAILMQRPLNLYIATAIVVVDGNLKLCVARLIVLNTTNVSDSRIRYSSF
jgi:hypothetical protein